MKNAIKILSLLTLVLFAACKKDDEKSSDDSIVGTWALIDMSCDDGAIVTDYGDGTTIESSFTTYGQDYNAFVTFNDDGSFTSSGTYGQVIKTIIDGFEQTQEVAIDQFLSTGTYVVSGSTLTSTVNGESSSGEIITLDADNFELRVTVNQVDDFGGGISSTTDATFNYKMERQ